MRKLSEEKLEIINEVLQKYFKSPEYQKIKKCKYFNPEKMAGYVEKKLSAQEDKEFEKHLFKCKYCLKIYTNLKNEIDTLFKIKLRKISKKLLTDALHFVEEEYRKNKLKPNTSEIIIKIKEKGIELIEAINFNKVKPVPIPALRNKHNILLKEILVEGDFKNSVYTLKIQSYSNNRICVEINFSDTLFDEIKNNRLQIVSKNTRISKNIEKDMQLKDLPKDNYKLLIDRSPLIKFEVI